MKRDSRPHSQAATATPAPARPGLLRQVNTRSLLRLLREHAPCSKADLVRHSGLSAPAVAAGIAQLKSLGLAESLGGGTSNGGRPPELLRFPVRHGFVAAADIGGTRLRLLLADLDGAPTAEWSTVLGREEKTPEAVCRLISEGLTTMCRAKRVARRSVLHLTAGAPGITDVQRGIVLSAPNLKHWNDVPLRSLLRRVTGLPVEVENDTNLAALGEHLRGVARGVESFIFLALGTGLGAGVFLGGKIHHGAQWTAGEVGYFGTPGSSRGSLRLRKAGLLESVIGGAGIERLWSEELARRGVQDVALRKLRAPHILDRAHAGDEAALSVLRSVATTLAAAITDVCLLLNPELVVLGGGIGAHPALCRATEALLSGNEFARPRLSSSTLGSQAQLFGGVAVSLAAIEARLLC